MTQASQIITQQYVDGGVVGADLQGQQAVSKKYVDDQLAIRDGNISAAQRSINNHILSTSAHPAQNITYSGEAAGKNVKQALDFLDNRINTIVQGGSPSKDSELVDIRTPDPSYTPSRTINVAGDIIRDMQARISGRWFDVRNYGVIGDGTTDDTEKILDTINACGMSGGGVVLFPPGKYKITRDIRIKHSNVYLVGSGRGATEIIGVNANLYCGHYQDVDVRGVLQNMGISDMTLNAASILTEDVKNMTFERLIVHSTPGYGIGLTGSDIPNRENCTIRDCEIYNTHQDGIDIKSGFQQVLIENCYVHDTIRTAGIDSIGIDIRGNYITVRNCVVKGVIDHGVRIRTNAGQNITIENVVSMNSGLDGFTVETNAGNNISLINCRSISNRSGFVVADGNIKFINCLSRNNINHGIHLAGRGVNNNKYILTTCRSSDNGLEGLRIESFGLVRVSNTELEDNTRHGIWSSSAGLQLEIFTSSIKDNGVDGVNTGYGILIDNADKSASIQNNRFTNTGADQKGALRYNATSTAKVIFTNNIIENHVTGIVGSLPTGSISTNLSV